MKITLELEAFEALMVLDPIQHGALEDQRIAATSKGEKAEHASVRAQVRQRVATMIVDAVYPESAIEEAKRRILEDEIEFGLV